MCTISATIARYLYDGLNHRVKKDVESGTDVVYVYDGWQVLEEREEDGADNWEARRQFIYGGCYIDELLIFDKDTDSDGYCAETGGSKRYLYCVNNNYNVMALADSTGAAVERVKYDPYGKPTASQVGQAQATGNAYLFQGRRWDNDTGLYYFRNRDYSPVLGRFLQRDPLGYADGMNVYALTSARPLSVRDPLGLQPDYDRIWGPLRKDEVPPGAWRDKPTKPREAEDFEAMNVLNPGKEAYFRATFPECAAAYDKWTSEHAEYDRWYSEKIVEVQRKRFRKWMDDMGLTHFKSETWRCPRACYALRNQVIGGIKMLVIYKQTKEDLERDLEKNRQLQRRGELMRYGSYAIGGWAAQPLLAALFGIGSFVDPLWDPDVAGVGLYEDVMKATVLNEVEVQRRLFDAHDQYRAIDCDRLCGWDYLQRWSRITEGRRVLKEE